jgi:hypothetical protein
MIKEPNKSFVVRQKICRLMICAFGMVLVIIALISIIFFNSFVNKVLDMSVVNIFYVHTHSILNDIIQVKKNDFMLSQNELKISKILIVDIIER